MIFVSEAAGQAYIHAFLQVHRRAIERLANVELIVVKPGEIPDRSIPIRIPFKYLKPGD